MSTATHTPAGSGPHQLMLGTVTVSKLLGADQTDGQLSLVELRGLPRSGPGAHIDPWRETFYIIRGQLTFRVEHDGVIQALTAGPGDVVSIPAGVGHAFSVTGEDAALYLIASTPAGIDQFFADAGEQIHSPELPQEPRSFDRERLRAAFAAHGHPPYEFPAEHAQAT